MGRLCLNAVAILAVMASGSAYAQNCLGRPDFDQCMMGFTAMQQNRLAQSQQQLFQYYIQTNGPWLRQNYAAHRAAGGQMSFEQFAYWGMMTANGTNIEGGLQAQRDAFAGQRRAHDTVMEGNRDFNQGMYNNSRRMDEAVTNYANGAIRGVAPYVDPQTGRIVQLPYGTQPGQPFNCGGQIYVQDNNGTYYQRQGNGWMPMNPGR